MEFVARFLDIQTWVTLLNLLTIPLQTLADFVFDTLPTFVSMINDFLVILADTAELGIDFLRNVMDVVVDLFNNGVYDLIKTLLNNALAFIRATQPILEGLLNALITLINWIMQVLTNILNAIGNLFGGDGFEDFTWIPITGGEGSGLGGGGFAGGGSGFAGGGSHARP